MKTILHKLFAFFKKPLGITIVIFIVLLGGIYFYFFREEKVNKEKIIKVERGTIVSEVLVTGNIVSSQDVKLSFVSSGKIKKIYVQPGEAVKTGDLLIVQDTELLEKELEKAKSSLKSAEANYIALKKGSTAEELAFKEAQVKSAEIALDNSLEALKNAMQDAYIKMDEAIYSDADLLFNEARFNPHLIFEVSDAQLQINVENERKVVGKYLEEWKEIISSLKKENISLALEKVKMFSDYLQKFVNDLAVALNNSLASEKTNANQIASWRTSVSLARSKVSSALNLLSNAENNFKNSQAALEVAKSDLALKKAPPTKEALEMAESSFLQAQSQVNLIQSQINQAFLRSPIKGIVVEVYPKEGEIVSAGQVVISIIGDKSLEIESYVSESDVAKISLGNIVNIKLDAFPNETFTGKVSFVNSAPLSINNIYQYKIKVSFDNIDARFKAGMTANLTIQTAKKEGVLIVPQYAILKEKEGAFVFKMSQGKEEKIPVILGMQDQKGNVEVISGLEEGDEVLNIGLK